MFLQCWYVEQSFWNIECWLDVEESELWLEGAFQLHVPSEDSEFTTSECKYNFPLVYITAMIPDLLL